MSKLEELILKYCPKGVKRIKLGDCCNLKRGSTITAKDAIEGDIPVVAGGKTPAYYHNASNRTGETITIAGSGAYAGFVAYWNKPIFVSDAFTVAPKDNGLLVKYIYYFLINIQEQIYNTKRGSGVPHVQPSSIDGFSIPLPPLPVQEEIVRILDSMVDLQNNIEAELKERKKQYEHYRDSFLSSDELNKKEIDWKSLQEVGYFYGGLNGKTKNDFVNGNAKYITYMNIYSHPKLSIDIKDKVSVLPNEKQNTIEYCDILFTGSSETPDECGMSSVVTQHIQEPIYLNSFCFGYRFNNVDNIHPNYMVHLFRSKDIRDKIGKTANGVTRFNISKKAFGNITIPIPSIKIQKEIANKLDLMIDFIDNLEAELIERRRQYEYYRNKLLSFE